MARRQLPTANDGEIREMQLSFRNQWQSIPAFVEMGQTTKRCLVTMSRTQLVGPALQLWLHWPTSDAVLLAHVLLGWGPGGPRPGDTRELLGATLVS